MIKACVLALLLVLTPAVGYGQVDSEDPAPSGDLDAGTDGTDGSTDTAEGGGKTDGSLSNYDKTSAAGNNVQSVEAELVSGDTIKPAIFPFDLIHSRLNRFYNFKERLNDIFGLAFGFDYSAMVQRSSFTNSGENSASSQVIRFYGTWLRFGSSEGNSGRLVWKTETRNPFGRNPTPREMGFDTGSVLSTANYKDLNYWGITDLYWKQELQGGKYGILVGHMDPGDWADQYPLLNAWTSFLNDAFYNNPTEAIPQRGFGLVGQVFLSTNTYILAGVHDANGKDGKLDYSGLSDTGELFSWVEYGYRSQRDISARHNAHIHFWHQDQRDEAETEESWGVAYTQSIVTKRDGVAFLRAGWSQGDAAQMRRFIGVGASYTPRGWDTLGIATSWGSPPETSLRNQITSEVFYRVQITQNLTMSPDIQIVYQPSYTKDKSWVFIPGLRMRVVF